MLGAVLNAALPITRMPAAFVILGAADIAGITLGAAILRARRPSAVPVSRPADLRR